MKPVIVFFIILFFFSSQSCKQLETAQNDVLEYSLNTLGDKFFSLMGDSSAKSALKTKYDNFVRRAVNGEADQDQIEYVAANILNASNSRDTIQPELAEQIVDATNPSFAFQSEKNPDKKKKREPLTSEVRMSIGENIFKLVKFNDDLKKSCSKKYSKEDYAQKVFFEYEDGLVLNVDEEIKSTLAKEDYEEVFAALGDLEKMHQVRWQKDLKEHLERERAEFRKEMKRIKIMHRDQMNDFTDLNILKQFEFEDSSFMVPYIPEVNVDSILLTVEQELRAAGISN